VFTRNVNNSSRLSLFRCNLNGTGCTHTDISSAAGTGDSPAALIDAVNQKVLIAAKNIDNNRLVLYRCNLDATGCTATYQSTIWNGGVYPQIALDSANDKLIIIGSNEYSSVGSFSPTLYRCDRDSTNCEYAALPKTREFDRAKVLVDSVNSKVLLVTQGYSYSHAKPTLFRIPLNFMD